MFKPYQIVIVKMQHFRCVGEVISRPYNETVMVRLVPNDPSTMVEVSTVQLSPTKNKYQFVNYALVYPIAPAPFPVRMLRYDFAAPSNFRLVETFNSEHGDYFLSPVLLPNHSGSFCIAEASTVDKPNWSYVKWRELGWDVKHLKTLPVKSGV